MEEYQDIVSMLRGRSKFCRDNKEIKTPDLLNDAANEIEYLREELENQEGLNDMYREENEELREALKQIRDFGPMTVDDQRWRIANAALQQKDSE